MDFKSINMYIIKIYRNYDYIGIMEKNVINLDKVKIYLYQIDFFVSTKAGSG